MTADGLPAVLEGLSGSCVRLGEQLWSEARSRNNSGKLSREEYKKIRAEAREMIQRSVEITTSASVDQLKAVQGSVKQLEQIGAELEQVTKNIGVAEDITKAALIAATVVTAIVATVAAPNPATFGGAVASVQQLASAVRPA